MQVVWASMLVHELLHSPCGEFYKTLEYKMPKTNRQYCFRTKPSIRNYANKILRRQRLINGHGETQSVIFFNILFLKYKILVMKNIFTIIIFNNDPKRFNITMTNPSFPASLKFHLVSQETGVMEFEHSTCVYQPSYTGSKPSQPVEPIPSLRQSQTKLLEFSAHLLQSSGFVVGQYSQKLEISSSAANKHQYLAHSKFDPH
ncbi:hypothetical protein IEQ34_022333 [Dendrobium chrysotoxum]|uniref:Uncharacterized protein n=1 Tax=Dendrobium chrysotoxum TaxID=161865 RepID=A0AAV7FYR8_DENCH|nr:hypothetical protein IEQ34_022333 [Dendrobium chrysotoxum]